MEDCFLVLLAINSLEAYTG